MRSRNLVASVFFLIFLATAFFLIEGSLGLTDSLGWNIDRGYEELADWDIHFNGALVGEHASLRGYMRSEDTGFSDTYEFEMDLSSVDIHYPDPTLCLRTYGTSTLVYQDSRLIYALSAKSEKESPASFDGGRYNLIQLDTSGDWRGSTIRIICVTSYDVGGHSFYPVFIGSRMALLIGVVCGNLAAMLVGIIILTLAVLIAMLALAMPERKARNNLLSSLFLVMVTGLWILTQNWTKQLLIDNVTIAIDLSYLMMALLPLASVTYVRMNFHIGIGKWMRQLENFAYTIITGYLLMYIWYIFLHRPYDIFLTINSTLIFLHFLCMLIASVHQYVKKKFEGGAILIVAISLYIMPIVLEQIFLVSQQPLSVQIVVYLPYFIAILLLLFQAVRQSMRDSRNAEARKKAIMSAFTDPLTGILNRSALENRLEREGLIKSGMYIFMFDVNGMKKCNDTYGHAAGDSLLKAFAESLKEATADLNCYLFRYGGDEFLLMVEEDEGYDTASLEKKIRRLFEKKRAWPDYDFSCGVVRYSSAVREDILLSIRDADSRMYFNKYFDINLDEPKR